MITVDFVNEEDVVEQRLKLDANAEYMCLDHTMIGAYTIRVDGECRVLHHHGFDVTLEDASCDVSLRAGNLLVISHPSVEVPDWDEIYREFHSS